MMKKRRIYWTLFTLGVVLALAGCDPIETPATPPVELANFEVTPGLVWPNVSVELRNRSSKAIQAVSWWATFLDGHNQTAYGLARNEVARFIWQSDRIAPGSTVQGTWTASWFDLAVRVDESGVCKVTFTDGAQWEPATHEPNC